MFTITVQQTIGNETVEVFKATRPALDMKAIFEATQKEPQRKRKDSGQRRTAQDPQTLFPATGGEKQPTP